jgi:hypothetical protein
MAYAVVVWVPAATSSPGTRFGVTLAAGCPGDRVATLALRDRRSMRSFVEGGAGEIPPHVIASKG